MQTKSKQSNLDIFFKKSVFRLLKNAVKRTVKALVIWFIVSVRKVISSVSADCETLSKFIIVKFCLSEQPDDSAK